MFKNLLKLLIVQEINAYKSRGLDLSKELNPLEQLKTFIDKPNTYLNFMSIPKIGINPQYDHGNIVGVYGYPATMDTVMKYFNGQLMVGQGRKYINIFSFIPSNNVINTATYKEETYENDLLKLKSIFGVEKVEAALKACYLEYRDHPVTKLLSIIRCIHNDNNKKMHSTLMQLGYDALVDNNAIYMQDTKKQIVVFNPTKINLLTRIENPFLNKNVNLASFKSIPINIDPETEENIRRNLVYRSKQDLLALVDTLKNNKTGLNLARDIEDYIADRWPTS